LRSLLPVEKVEMLTTDGFTCFNMSVNAGV
jgi:hypothetical protein